MALSAPALAPVRPFGQAPQDLDVAFAGHAPEDATTALLAACTGCDEATVQGWTLARRQQALLQVRLADDPQACLPAQLRCAACGEAFELELALAPCRADVDESPVEWTAPSGEHLRLRLPTAADLQRWQAAAPRSESHLAAALLRPPGSAVAEDLAEHLPEAWLEPLAAALAARDPFTALQVHAPCPACGHAHLADIELQTLLLADFAARQRRLLDEVATLARAFHWSEAQILELPAWRRAHYIAHLDLGAGAAP